MSTTIFCIACESHSSGMVNWYTNENAADKQYAQLVDDPVFTTDTVTRFNLELDDNVDPEMATNEADAAMWELNYTPLKQRFGTDGVNLPSVKQVATA